MAIKALDCKVLTVTGQLFEFNPGRYRRGASPCAHWRQFSFGPPMENMKIGLERLEVGVHGG